MTWEELVTKVRARRPEMSHLSDCKLLENEETRLLQLQRIPAKDLTKSEIDALGDLTFLRDFMI